MTTGKDDGAEPETMEALLALQAAQSQKLASRQVTWVKVIAVTGDSVLVDVGEKREGTVPLSDFAQDHPPVAGQRVAVVLLGSRDGAARLSHQRARLEMGWEAAVKSFKEKQRVRGLVTQAIKGGFLVDVNGVTGFLPTSLSDLRPVREPKRMLRTGVRCYIIEVNEAKKQLVLSRKAVLAEEAGKRRDELLAKLRVGEVRVGRVVNVLPAGAVVDIGGAEGLVRSADMAWNPAKAPKLRRGDKLRVKVLSKPAARPEGQAAQPQAEPIALGIKQLSPNPADALKRKYAPKATVRGKVLEAGAAGVRLELADKAVAFAGAAEIDAQAAYKPGQELSAIVLGVNAQTCEVMVSINKYDEIKERKRLAQYLKAPPPLTLGQLLAPEEREGE